MRTFTLRVLCEGQTEQNFVVRTLVPHLRAFNVFPRAELLPGGGGIVSWERVRNAIKKDVGRSRAHEYVTTLVDLYGIVGFPDMELQPDDSGAARATRIEAGMARSLGNNPHFVPYVQPYEFEALVLVDPDELKRQFPDGEANDAPAKLRDSIGATPPEEVNDGSTSHPSARIIAAVPEYMHQKATAGPIIASRIGLQRLRSACPHFGGWIAQLESLK